MQSEAAVVLALSSLCSVLAAQLQFRGVARRDFHIAGYIHFTKMEWTRVAAQSVFAFSMVALRGDLELRVESTARIRTEDHAVHGI